MKYWLIALLNPTYWFRNHHTSQAWDSQLRSLMASHKFEYISEYEAKLGDVRMWISNHPYASFQPMKQSSRIPVMPSRRTSARAWEKYIREVMES